MKSVTVEATGYVPRQRRGEEPAAAAGRVHRRLLAATHYLLYSNRRGAAEERRLFTGASTALPLADARTQIATHYGPTAAFHRLVLSPHPRLGLDTEAEAQRWTRTLLRRTDARMARRLIWVGAVHRDTAIPHAHLIVAGADAAGAAVRVRVPLLRWMEETGAQIAGEIMTVQAARWARLDREG